MSDETCEHCGQRPVDGHGSFFWIRGWILWASFGEHRIVACTPCFRRQGLQQAFLTALLGWFALPWGLVTPVVVGQNLFRTWSGPRQNVQRKVRLGEDIAIAATATSAVLTTAKFHTPWWGIGAVALLAGAVALNSCRDVLDHWGLSFPTPIELAIFSPVFFVAAAAVLWAFDKTVRSYRLERRDETLFVWKERLIRRSHVSIPIDTIRGIRAHGRELEIVTEEHHRFDLTWRVYQTTEPMVRQAGHALGLPVLRPIDNPPPWMTPPVEKKGVADFWTDLFTGGGTALDERRQWALWARFPLMVVSSSLYGMAILLLLELGLYAPWWGWLIYLPFSLVWVVPLVVLTRTVLVGVMVAREPNGALQFAHAKRGLWESLFHGFIPPRAFRALAWVATEPLLQGHMRAEDEERALDEHVDATMLSKGFVAFLLIGLAITTDPTTFTVFQELDRLGWTFGVRELWVLRGTLALPLLVTGIVLGAAVAARGTLWSHRGLFVFWVLAALCTPTWLGFFALGKLAERL